MAVSPRWADPLCRRSVRVSMGSDLQVPWTLLVPWRDGLDVLRAGGFVVASLALDDLAVPPDESVARGVLERTALMLGAEGDGLSHGAQAGADLTLTIPMGSGPDSLNVAAPSAVAFRATRATEQDARAG